MPKIVDSAERLEAISLAACRVIARDGFEQATLRNVATEAGLAIGSVRHYAGSHGELLDHTMRLLAERISGRILAHVARLDDAPDRLEVVLDLLAEALPVDARRREETLVWLEFLAAARTRPELARHGDELFDGLRTITRKVASRIDAKHGGGIDVDLEAERLAALVDGLALDGTHHPERLTADRMRTLLRHHLTSIRPAN